MASSAAMEIIDGMVDGDGVEEGRAAIVLFFFFCLWILAPEIARKISNMYLTRAVW